MPLSFRRAALLVALATSQLNGANAFAPNKSQVQSMVSKTSSTAHEMQTKQGAPTVASDADKNSYGEKSRQYRRTVYTHEDWVKHRSPNRFGKNLMTFGSSGIFKNLANEVIATTSVASFIVAWNCVFGTYQDLGGVVHNGLLHDSIIPILALPLAPFTLASPSLGLLLGKSYISNITSYILYHISHIQVVIVVMAMARVEVTITLLTLAFLSLIFM
jgi:hypothetical protein